MCLADPIRGVRMGSACKLTVLLWVAANVAAQSMSRSSADRMIPPVVAPFHPITTAVQAPTEKDRVDEYLKNLLDPFSLVSAGASAGIGQWRDKPREWGEGGKAYAQRYVSAYTQHIVYTTMLFAGASVFREDNRYLPSGRSGFGTRLAYALKSTFWARRVDSSGQIHRHISISKLSALAGAALISRLWQPKSGSSLQSAAVSFGVSLGSASGFNVEREFLPGFPQ